MFHSKENHKHKISVLTLSENHVSVTHVDTPSSPFTAPFLPLPSYPTFPSHPWGVLGATAETTDGAQHHPESERDGERE